jgi:4,5-dihydroxyphthalate decarboxylase
LSGPEQRRSALRRAPSSFQRGEPHIARLFPDTRQAEMAYFKKTGLFPIMHLVGIRKTLLAQYPWLASSIYKAFCEAKALAVAGLRDVNALVVTLPFLEAETRETMAAMGEDFWRYGVHENIKEIEALTSYAFEQRLVDRKLEAAELFAPSVCEISKV